MNARLTYILLALTLAWALTGCSKQGPKLIKVRGTLTSQGKPIPNLDLIFRPVDIAKQQESLATTDAQGKFMMSHSQGEGVVPGVHTVYVRDPSGMLNEQSGADAAILAVLRKYGDPATSPMKLTVDKDLKDYDLKLD